jgi:cyclomaltodextrinase / maltogenic alpha-amylase / neopullulanase
MDCVGAHLWWREGVSLLPQMNTDTHRCTNTTASLCSSVFICGKFFQCVASVTSVLALTLLISSCATTQGSARSAFAVGAERSSCIPSPLGTRPLYLRGAFNNWNALESYRFTYSCNTFEAVAAIKGEHHFKLGDEQWSTDADFGGVDNRESATRKLQLKGTNLSYNFNGTHRFRFRVPELVMTIEQCPSPPLGDKTIYLRGTMNNWGALDDFALNWRCDAYYLNVNLASGQEFKIADAQWGEASTFGLSPKSNEALKLQSAPLALARTSDADGAANVGFMFNGPQTLKLEFEGSVAKLSVTPTSFDDPSTQPIADPVALSVKFDSRNTNFKKPFGAVVEGTTVEYSLASLPSVEKVTLVVEKRLLEGNQEVLEYNELARIPMQRASDGWRASYHYRDIAIYGYYFEVLIAGKTFIYGNNRDSIFWTRERGSNGLGEIVEKPEKTAGIRRFRQTVYSRDFKVPEWAPDIVYYYIFPDRFRNGNRANDPKPGVDKYQHHTVEFHRDWNEKPFRPKSGDGSDDVYNNDFFGGDLAGITEKLDYIKSLGANTIYMTPIFRAPSNHKYDTADYNEIDPYFGSEAEFVKLCDEAKKRGIRIVLDTSLNHVGSDSRYFDRFGNYALTEKPPTGAFAHGQINAASPYVSWFSFDRSKANPDQQFKGWTGITDLPEIDKSSKSFRAFAYGDADSVMKRWLARGASGWRMDVAPWVPDDFWREWRTAIRAHTPDAITISETWFDSSKYLLGDMFDSTMNYIFRNTVQEYALGGDARKLYQNLELIREHYPPQAQFALMNLLSSHDQARALHHFGYRDETSSREDIERAKRRLKLAVLFQVVYPGSPTIYYGDEVGVTGGEDPFNRGTYPWEDLGGKPDEALLAEFKRLFKLRNDRAVLRRGSLGAPLYVDRNVIVLRRELNSEVAIIALNNSERVQNVSFSLDAQFANLMLRDAFDSKEIRVQNGTLSIEIPAQFGVVAFSQRTK